jgi:hypothetical protein
MGIWFEPCLTDQCCLCGCFPPNLTGEHKIKASVLRSLFKKGGIAIARSDGSSQLRYAQGPKSRKIHFKARMCAACNGAQTQKADCEFDIFHSKVMAAVDRGLPPATVFDNPRYAKNSSEYLNVFRYFAKLLSCQIVDAGGPRAIQVTSFARGVLDQNPIFLTIERDVGYENFIALGGEKIYAAHGGLSVPMGRHSRLPFGFQTSLTIGPICYSFWVSFSIPVGLELMFLHWEFYKKCQAAFELALTNSALR